MRPISSRFDLKIPEDLVEEVARSIGLDNVPSQPIYAQLDARHLTTPYDKQRALRERLAQKDALL